MASVFESSAWHEAVAGIIAAGSGRTRADRLIAAVAQVVAHEGTCLIAFHKDASPDVLHHTIEPEGAEHYLDRYLDGPYLLDPLYELAMSSDKLSLCRFRDRMPDRFRSSEYYRKYYEQTHLIDEMDFIAEVSSRTTLVLVVARRTRRFTRAEVNRLELIQSIVQAAIRDIWDSLSDEATAAGDLVHVRLTECFENFGGGVLTEREHEISQLLLRGHSSKSIARELDIAPGTVIVHKRNMFAKLGVSSQYELFSLLLQALERG